MGLFSWKKKVLKARRRRRRFELFGEKAVGIAVQGQHGCFIVAPDDASVGRQLLTTGNYNPEELARLQSLLTDETNLLIVGAHIGAFVIPLSKHCRSVVAVEANPESFRLLEWNLQLNGCSNVRALPLAASNEKGTIDFVISRENSGGSKRMPVRKKINFFYDTPKVQTVPAEALDSVLGDEVFNTILMDIEGSEFFALQGMRKILQHANHLCVEFRPEHLRDVAGTSVKEFLAQIPERFSRVELPGQSLKCDRKDLLGILEAMFASDTNEDGILFSTSS